MLQNLMQKGDSTQNNKKLAANQLDRLTKQRNELTAENRKLTTQLTDASSAKAIADSLCAENIKLQDEITVASQELCSSS